jgi:hypothetical protein
MTVGMIIALAMLGKPSVPEIKDNSRDMSVEIKTESKVMKRDVLKRPSFLMISRSMSSQPVRD